MRTRQTSQNLFLSHYVTTAGSPAVAPAAVYQHPVFRKNIMAMSCARKIAIIFGSLFLAFALVVVIGVVLIFSALSGSEPAIRENSVLILKVDGELPDYVPDTLARRLLGDDELSLTTLIEQLRKAKVDKRISAVVLEIDLLGTGWGKAEELRGAIADFRASG